MAQAFSSLSRPVGVALEAVALVVVAFVVANIVGVAFLVPLFVLGYDFATTLVVLGATAVGQLTFLLVGYGYVRTRDVPVRFRVPSLSTLPVVAGGVVAALVVAITLSLVLAALDLVPGSVVAETASADPTFLLGLAALSVLVVAPAEELLFRGAIQGRLGQRFGPITAIAVASLLFGSLHLANYTGSLGPILAGAGLIACVGAVFGALYEYTENLAVPIAVHATYNVLLLVAGYLTV